jgi:hypothetical protein
MKTTIYSFLLISIFVISCKKDGTNDVAFEGGITITSPNAGDTISGTQTIVTRLQEIWIYTGIMLYFIKPVTIQFWQKPKLTTTPAQ